MISTLRMTVAVYVVCGINGVIIADTYGRALYCRKYLLHANIKRYEDYAEAEQAALNHLAAIVPYGVVKTRVAACSWTHWLKIPYLNYIEETEEGTG